MNSPADQEASSGVESALCCCGCASVLTAERANLSRAAAGNARRQAQADMKATPGDLHDGDEDLGIGL